MERNYLIIQRGKQLFYGLWLLVILYLIYSYLMDPSVLEVENLKRFMHSYGDNMLLVYVTVSLIRGFFLIPSTPFVLLGGLLFPEHKMMVLIISMIGVMFSATTLYYFSDALGFSRFLESKSSKKILRWKEKLQKPRAAYFVTAWSFFPLVPTDLICYIGGIVKMPFRYVFLGVFIGELLLNIVYVYWSELIPNG